MVSCCCVTYNHEQFIAQALDGMLMQETDFPYEVLVRDDCSTDNTAGIISQYATSFPNIIRPIFETNNQFSKGVRPMPVVLKKADGQYIAFCEGDDYWVDKAKLQKQIDFLSKHEGFVISFGNCMVIDELGNILSNKYLENPRDFSGIEMIAGEAPINTNTAVFRNIIEPCPEVFRSIMGGDTSFWHLLGFHGNAKYQGEIEFSAYRQHSGGVWSNRSVLEMAVGIVQTRLALKENLEKNCELRNRLDTNVTEILVGHLIQIIRGLDIFAIIRLSTYVFNNSEIDSLAVFKLLLRKAKGKMRRFMKKTPA